MHFGILYFLLASSTVLWLKKGYRQDKYTVQGNSQKIGRTLKEGEIYELRTARVKIHLKQDFWILPWDKPAAVDICMQLGINSASTKNIQSTGQQESRAHKGALHCSQWQKVRIQINRP